MRLLPLGLRKGINAISIRCAGEALACKDMAICPVALSSLPTGDFSLSTMTNLCVAAVFTLAIKLLEFVKSNVPSRKKAGVF
jgi:hypothetical protein